MPVLTLSMIVKNEEKYLRDCLESVKDIVDEIVLVDTGSTDKTIEIAREYNAKIFHFVWINDFSAARNYALSKSTGKWILYLDADERLSKDSIGELRTIIKSNGKDACFCSVNSTDPEKPNKMFYTRLFRNNHKIKFKGNVHEQIIESLKKENYKIRNSGIEIIHIGYDISKEDLQIKAKRNLTHLLSNYKPGGSAYDDFQIAQTYAILEEKKNAVEYFSKVLNYKCPDFYKAHSHRYIASHELAQGNIISALVHIEKGLSFDKEQPLLNMVASKVYLRMQKYAEALLYCRYAYEYNKDKKPKDFEIYINDKILIYMGLQQSVMAKNIDYFNYFYDKLTIADAGEAANNVFVVVVKKIFNNEHLELAEIEQFKNFINAGNLEFLLSLVENYNNADIKITILEHIFENYKNTPAYLNVLGLVLMQNERMEEAEKIFTDSIAIEFSDPSVVFYLVSIYISLNKFNLIPSLIESAESRFINFPEVNSRLQVLRQKISLFL
ncbi:MAG: glycosyltransferase [Ignavibacteria bacterium]